MGQGIRLDTTAGTSVDPARACSLALFAETLR